jgi:virginiamycin B lyase
MYHYTIRQADGSIVGEYPIPVPNVGARCICAWPDGRLFFTAFDAGLIGEVIPQ